MKRNTNFIISLILIVLIPSSCKESEIERLVIDSYQTKAIDKDVPIEIYNITILDQDSVGDNYFRELITRDLNSVISDSNEIIRLLEEKIALQSQSIKEKN